MGIANTHLDTLKWCIETTKVGFIGKNNGTNIPCFKWIISGYGASELLRYLLPYLKIKSHTATLAIQWADADDSQRSEIKTQISEINQQFRKVKANG
jgi:hypothetical protein